MIVHYQITAMAYDRTKWGIPTSILARVPLPSNVTITDVINDDKRRDLICEEFLEKCGDMTIENAMNLFKKELGNEYEFSFPYNYRVLVYAEPLINDDYPFGILDMSTTPSVEAMKARLTANDVLPMNAALAVSHDDVCMCCKLTESIYDVLEKFQSDHAINCPHCGKEIEYAVFDNVAVQEANYYRPEHHIGMYPVTKCPHCNRDIAMIPTAIEYNANHDVYYTGGASYMADQFDKDSAAEEIQKIFEEKLWPSIRQFVTRKLDPKDATDEGLTLDGNLELWTSRNFAAAMCEYFYKHGLKE